VHLEQWDKTKYYVVIFDQLQGHSRELMRALESHVRGPLTLSNKCQMLSLPLILSHVIIKAIQAYRCLRQSKA